MKFHGFRRAVEIPAERPAGVRREVDEELAFHLAMREERLRRRGLAPDEAAVEARRRFGDLDAVRAECVATDTVGLRSARAQERAADVVRDARIAARALRRSPGFTVSCIALLALGIGGSTSVFSIVSAIAFRPLPYPAADRLAIATASRPDPRCGGRCAQWLSTSELDAWRARTRAIDAIGTLELQQGVVDVPSGALVLEGAAVNAELFPLLGLQAAIGRALGQSDFDGDAPDALVLSHSAWESEFGGDTAVVGQRATIEGRTYHIVGVLAPRSELGPPIFSFNVRTAQYFVPRESASTASQLAIVRMRPGTRPSAVESELTVALHDAGAGTWQASIVPLRSALVARYRGSFLLLFAASCIVLLLACMNVGALFVARLHDRLPELATRAVLGAGRARLVQQVLTETAIVTACGAIAGVTIGAYGVRAARLIPIDRLPFWTPVVMDVRVVLLGVALGVAAGLVCGVAPAMVLSPQRMLSTMRYVVSSATSRARVRSALVSVEIALSVVLFVVAGLLVEQLIAAERRELATAKHSVVFVAVSTATSSADASWPDRAIAVVRELPHVTHVAVSGMPVRPSRQGPPPTIAANRAPHASRRIAVYAEGRDDAIPDLVFPLARVVTPDYFAAVGMPIVEGRSFTAGDLASTPAVAIVNATAAREAFPNASAIGRRIRVDIGGASGDWLTIIGITADNPASPFDESLAPRPTLFRPWSQLPATASSVAIHVAGDSRAIVPLLRGVFHSIDPAVPIVSIAPIETWVDNAMWSARFTTRVLAAFALFALLLACLGVYALVTFVVSRRRRELAIRIAIGATRGDLLASVLIPTARLLGTGVGVGVVLALVAARLLRAVLFGSHRVDPAVLTAALLAICTAGFVAAYLPARRAASADPLSALRATDE